MAPLGNFSFNKSEVATQPQRERGRPSDPGPPTKSPGKTKGRKKGGLSFAPAPTSSNIILHIPFNNLLDTATTAYDFSLNPHGVTDFQLEAQIDTAQFKFGSSSLLLDGINDHVRLLDDADWQLPAGAWSIEAWVRFNNTDNVQEIIGQYRASGDQRSWRLFFSATTGLGFSLYDLGTATAKFAINFAWAPSTDTWYHVAVCRDAAGTTRLFVDGLTGGDTSADNTASFASTSPLRIGILGALTNDFNGWIQDVRIIVGDAVYVANFAVPTAALDTTYNSDTDSDYDSVVLLLAMNGVDAATTFPDHSKFDQVVASVDGDAQVDTAVSKFGGASLLVDGTGDVIQIADSSVFTIATGQDFTIEMWVNFVGDATSAAIWFAGWGDTSGNQRSWLIGTLTDEKMQFIIHPLGSNTNRVLVTSDDAQTWTQGVWYHIAVDRNSADLIRIYKDGVVLASSTSDAAGFNSASELSVGARLVSDAANSEFNGNIDGFRYTVGVARYDGAFTPATAAWPTHP